MINRRFLLGFSVAIALVIAVGLISYVTLRKQAAQQQWVEHTYKVLNDAEYIERLLVDMETGQRGFRGTNERLFLEPYYNSLLKLPGALEELRRDLNSDDRQNVNITALEAHVGRLDSLWKNVDVDNIYKDETMRRQTTHLEKTFMDVNRIDISRIEAVSAQVLTQRQQESKAAIEQAILAIVLGTIFILIVVFVLIRLILSENRNRTRAENELHKTIARVNEINEQTQQANQRLGSIREINGSLIGNDSLPHLVGNLLDTLVRSLGAAAGALYFYEPDVKRLERIGQVALPEDAPQSFAVGEGIVGKAGMHADVTVVKDIPSGYWQLRSGAGHATPGTVVCVPLWKRDLLIGVIELAFFTRDVAETITVLNDIAANIALGVMGADTYDKTQVLIRRVQEQKDELESQQEELRQTNEELNHQAEVLRASEEELRTQEEELRQINAELEDKTEAVELARKSLQEKANELEITGKYKSEFLANMSHELRTPLNSVLILANLLKENKGGNLTAKQTDSARIIHKSGSDLLNLINDILDLSKIEAGKIDFFFEPVRVTDMASDLEQLFAVQATEKKVNFNIEVSPAVPATVITDKQRLEQVIKNLLSNAFKFTPADGRVTLRFNLVGERLSIAVTDTGIGIPEEKQRIIFEAFQQADGSTNRKYGGTGLGLSISKELLSKLGGEMQLESRTGAGSTFTVLVPLDHSAQQPAGGVSILKAAPTPADTDYDLSNVQHQTRVKDDKNDVSTAERFILIVEDDAVFAGMVNDYAHEKGFKTIVALSGDEGLLYARQYRPSAIILDLGLPVIDGRNILRALKADEVLKAIPVHVVSAEDRWDISSDDIQSYARKPLLKDELEDTFSSISRYISDHYKSILIVADKEQMLSTLFDPKVAGPGSGITYEVVADVQHALPILDRNNSDCIIADIGSDIPGGIGKLRALREHAKPGTYIITCLDGDIQPSDEKGLKQYTDAIIRKTRQAGSRLMDEVELFLHRVDNAKDAAVPQKYMQGSDTLLEGKKVLLADDDMRNVFALTSLLEDQGMNVVSAENGREAIDALTADPTFDIVLMDIMMPEMDGYEATRAIRMERRFARLPIVALTAKAMSGDREKCIEAGASDYITKPIENQKLLSLMRVWLSGRV